MSLDYDTYISQISNLMVVPSSDPNFETMIPGMISYAENRLYRELDLLFTQVTDTGTVTASVRNFTLPTNTGAYIIVDQINILSSAGTTSSNGSRNPLTPVTREFIDMCYPSGQDTTAIPEYFAMASNTVVIFGPAPDAAYTAEVIGTQRPTALTSANSSTILTQYVPDLMIAASMIFGSAYMRNFGAESDNPQMSQSWEGQYNKLFQSAATEQARAKFQSEGWTSEQPSPIATPKRV